MIRNITKIHLEHGQKFKLRNLPSKIVRFINSLTIFRGKCHIRGKIHLERDLTAWGSGRLADLYTDIKFNKLPNHIYT